MRRHINPPTTHTHTHTHTDWLAGSVCVWGGVCSVWQRWALWWLGLWGWARASLTDRGGGEKKGWKKRTQQLFFNEWMKQTEDMFSGFWWWWYCGVLCALSFTLSSLLSFSVACTLFFHSFLCFLSLNRTPLAHTYVAYSPSRRARDVTNMAQL